MASITHYMKKRARQQRRERAKAPTSAQLAYYQPTRWRYECYLRGVMVLSTTLWSMAERQHTINNEVKVYKVAI